MRKESPNLVSPSAGHSILIPPSASSWLASVCNYNFPLKSDCTAFLYNKGIIFYVSLPLLRFIMKIVNERQEHVTHGGSDEFLEGHNGLFIRKLQKELSLKLLFSGVSLVNNSAIELCGSVIFTFKMLRAPPAVVIPGISASTIKENKLRIRLLFFRNT